MRSTLWLALVVAVSPAIAAPKKKVVLVDAPAAVSKVLIKTLNRTTMPRPVRASLGATPTAKGVREACKPSGASAIVLARPQGALISVMVVSCSDGSPLDSVVLKARGLRAIPPKDARTILAAIAGGKQAGAEPASEPAEPVSEEKPKGKSTPTTDPDDPLAEPARPSKPSASKPSPTTEREPSRTSVREEEPEPKPKSGDTADLPQDGLPAFIAHIGFRGFGRNLGWAMRAADEPIPFSNSFIGAPAADLTWYPASKLTTSFARHLGVTGLVDSSLGSPTRERTSGEAFTTTATRWRVAAAVRFPFASRFEAGATVGLQGHSFVFGAASAPSGFERGPLPSVSYFGPRIGARFSVGIIGPMSIEAFGGLTFLTSLGEVGSDAYFPKARGIGFDLGGAFRLRFDGGLSAFAAFDWQRYNLTLNPAADARLTATAAGDSFLAGTVGVGFAL